MFTFALLSLSTAARNDRLDELSRCMEPNCRAYSIKGSLYCSYHKDQRNGCMRILPSGKRCGARLTNDKYYCFDCRKIVDGEIQNKVNADIAEAREQGELLAKLVILKERREQEKTANAVAEGVAQALGKQRCAWSDCKEYVDKTVSYCDEHIELAKLRAKRERESLEREARAKASIKRCGAVFTNGWRCQLDSMPYSDYCAMHKNFDPKHPIEIKVDRKLVTDQDYIDETKERLALLNEETQKYIARSHGVPPSSLITLQVTSIKRNVLTLSDAWKRKFYYETDGVEYIILSKGKDGIIETDDDILVRGKTSDTSEDIPVATDNELKQMERDAMQAKRFLGEVTAARERARSAETK